MGIFQKYISRGENTKYLKPPPSMETSCFIQKKHKTNGLFGDFQGIDRSCHGATIASPIRSEGYQIIYLSRM